MMKTYHGSCHCGSIKFEIDADLSEITLCTCSMCSKKGGLFCYVSPDQFRQLQGEDDLVVYRFNTEQAKHNFCKHCGIHAFGHPRSTPEIYLVNVRCLDDFDLETKEYEVKLFDGLNWEAAYKARLESG